MKIWGGYGSEHSMNLVMIGHFRDVTEAAKANEIIAKLTQQVNQDLEIGQMEIGKLNDRYSGAMLDLLGKLNVHSIEPAELEQFAYDATIKVEREKLVLTTDEVGVSAFMKVMLDRGARVEVYSAHEHHGTGYGRGT